MFSTDEGVVVCCGSPAFWVECDIHDEEGCYMACCEDCDTVDRDCEEAI